MAFLCPVRIKRNKKKKQAEEKQETPKVVTEVKALEDADSRGPAPAMGRITGSASIETLVRVGIEKENGLSPESKMVVLHDFTPCVDDELEVRRGQVVHVLYQENDWVYVISEDNKEGFIPHSYCAQFGSQLAGLALNVKKKMPRGDNSQGPGEGIGVPGGLPNPQSGGLRGSSEMLSPPDLGHLNTVNSGQAPGKVNPGLEQSDSDSFQDSSLKLTGPPDRGGRNISHQSQSQSRSSSLLSESSLSQGGTSATTSTDVQPFYKDSSYGKFIVLYSYHAQDENDLSVDRGQIVTVLNKDDPEWFWVLRHDGQEGFVPAGFVYPLDAIQRQSQPLTSTPSSMSSPSVQALGVPSSTSGSAPSSLSPGMPPPGGGGGPQQHQQQTQQQVPSQGHSYENPTQSQNQSQGSGASHGGTELVMLYDYKAQAPDDLSVRRGDWVYADLTQQTVDGWLWAYAPKTRKYGFIPKAYARPPAMTSL